MLLKFRQKLFLCCSCIMAYFIQLCTFICTVLKKLAKTLHPGIITISCRKCFLFYLFSNLTVELESFLSQNGFGFYELLLQKKSHIILNKNMTLFIAFRFYPWLGLKQNLYMTHLINCLSSILKYYRCKIHRYVSAPLLNFSTPLLRPNPKSLTGGIKSTLAWGKDGLWRGVAYSKCVRVDSAVKIGWESTPRSNRPCFSLDSAFDDTGEKGRLIIFIYRQVDSSSRKWEMLGPLIKAVILHN